jgi:hypothetical protein
MGKGGRFFLRLLARRVVRVLWIVSLIGILGVIPWMVVGMHESGFSTHTIADTIAGCFTLVACSLSFYLIAMHLEHFSTDEKDSKLQKHVVRIVAMVPIYALNAWFALLFKDSAFFLDTIRKLYEAFVLYSFFTYLVEYLGGFDVLYLTVEKKEKFLHLFPFCLIPPWEPGKEFVEGCRTGVHLYVFFRVITSLLAFILEPFGWYHGGNLSLDSVYLYTTIINNCVSMWAVYCLVIFYLVLEKELRPIDPLAKFLCVKSVVFFAWWQSVILVIAEQAGLLNNSSNWTRYDVGDIAIGIQCFCICIEMLFLAMWHMTSFSYKEYLKPDIREMDAEQTVYKRALLMFDFRDIGRDVISTTTHPVLPHAPEVDRHSLDPLLGPRRVKGGPGTQEQGPVDQSPQLDAANSDAMGDAEAAMEAPAPSGAAASYQRAE